MKKTALAAAVLVATAVPCAAGSYDDLNVAIAYFDQQQYDNAITWFDKAVAAGDMLPDLTRIAYLDRGVAYQMKGDLQKALADDSAAIAAKPDDMLAYRQRASLYLAGDNLEKALADYEALRKLRPHDHDILLTTGYLDWLLGDTEASADAFSYFSKRSLYPWLWLQLANTKLGRPMTELDKSLIGIRGWPTPVTQFYLGQMSEADLLERANDFKNVDGPCSAFTLTGMWHAVHHDQAGAAPLLQSASDKCAKGSFFWRIARAELERATPGDPK